MIFRRACSLAVFVTPLWMACKSDKAAPADSVAVIAPPTAQPPTVAVNTGWEESAGTFLVTPVSSNREQARVILPFHADTMLSGSAPPIPDSVLEARVDLFNRTGVVGSTSLVSRAASPGGEACPSWPEARLADAPSKDWMIGFPSGVASPLPLDSLEGMSSADSTTVVQELARMSSAAAEGDDPAFGGLPFAVRKAYRFSIGSESVLVGDIVRKINEEANPREERILLVAEKPTATGSYATVFHTRVAGSEDAVRTSDILGAVRFVRTGRPAVMISFEYDDGGRLVLLQRINRSVWRMTWRSAYAGCR